jgi:hypothetical protein
VLSLYRVDQPAWQGRDLLTALRLMCIPRVLVQRVDDIDESCLAPAMDAGPTASASAQVSKVEPS